MDEIRHDVQKFYDSLRAIEAELSKLHHKKKQSAEGILQLLHEPCQSLEAIASESTTKPLREAMQEQLGKWRACFAHCEKESRKRSAVQEKLQPFSRHLLVTVFGRTNAGKSTLGNFIKGKYLAKALFDNAYKAADGHEAALQCTPICVLEDACDAETVVPPFEWFKEGALETTREAQVFEAPGIVWLDTPGVGSITTNNEALARKYAEHTDVLLYLDGSDGPGLRTHASILRHFLERRCPTWAIINRSDKLQHVKDAEGKFVRHADGTYLKRLHPKPSEDRLAQQEQERNALREAGGEGYCGSLFVCSTSVQLAVLATTEEDPQQALKYWRGSNITAVYDIFADLAANPEKILRFKQAEGRRNLRDLVDTILKGTEYDKVLETEKMDGLEPILQKMKISLAALQDLDRQFVVDEETAHLHKVVLTRAQVLIGEVVESAAKANGKQPIDVDALMRQLADIMRDSAHQRAKKLLDKIFDDTSLPESAPVKAVQAPTLSRIKETHEYTVREVESYVRDPEGFVEHCFSAFGKKYRGYTTREVTKTQVIDLGFNTGEVRKELLDQVAHMAKEYLHNELSALKKYCLGAYIQALSKGITIVNAVMEKLHAQRKELED